MHKEWHKVSVQECADFLEVDRSGLGDDDIRARHKQYGENSIPDKGSQSWVLVLVRQFTSPLMAILLIAGTTSFFIGEVSDAIVILVAVLINAIVGFVQEWKAEKAAQALKSYEIPQARVRRNGKVQDIDARTLVPGDVVLLTTGSRIPADIRLIESVELQVDESLLTGESYPAQKSTEALGSSSSIGDRVNMAYLGTMVAGGRGEGYVVAIGEHTQLGDIAKLVSNVKDEATPLQKQIKKFSWQLGMLFVVVVLVMFAIGLVKGFSVEDMLGMAIALAVASIPEGLLVAVTVVLAIGMQKMLKRQALARRLVAAETLGGVSVVCTDKTGTITEGRMSVGRVVSAEHDLAMNEIMPDEITRILLMCAINNDAEVSEHSRVGHPTELALVDAAIKIGVNVNEARAEYSRVDEIPFTADDKYMVTAHRGRENIVVLKGAPEMVLKMCKMSDGNRARFESSARDMTENGLRVLAIATKPGELGELEDFECLGIVGLLDPLRTNAKETVRELNNAGVRVVVITGDHPATAKATAYSAGLLIKDTGVLVGHEIDEMNDQELQAQVRNVSVYARVNPRHKVRIVDAWKREGEVVAMVGDGVNDAAAMKSADIGVALGSGTDVAQQTSDMVLLDNNLSSITAAVKEGRVLFDNIRKIIVYLMSDSFSEIVLIGGSIMLGLPLPLLAVQILWINIVTDGLPDLALAAEPAESDVMERQPRKKSEPVVNGEMKMLIFIIGVFTDIGLLALFYILLGNGYEITHLRTIMFTALAIDSLFYVFSVRSLRHSIFTMNPFKNNWLNLVVVIGLALQMMTVYVPGLQMLFSTVALTLLDLVVLAGLSLFKMIIIEGAKEIFIVMKNRKHVAST